MINVIGLGYIGLPTALMIASCGGQVVGTDCDNSIVEQLRNRELTFYEEGLQDIFFSAIERGIKFQNVPLACNFYIIAVPTPYNSLQKKINADYLCQAVKDILAICEDGSILVIESTVSPGTIEKYIRPLVKASHKTINLAHAPERIIPGNMINELRNNSRVIGADDSVIGERVKKVYSIFCKGEIVVTDIKTAEMVKVVENTFRDVNIAFANELAKICSGDRMDVYEIIRIANMHPRVNILNPGPGVGGHCIAVDPWFLVGDYPGLANLILTARKTNDSMPEFVLRRISEIMDIHGIEDVSRVGLYGLTYKEDVDDVRESPTLQLLKIMKNHLTRGVKVFDPMISQQIVENQYCDFNNFIESVDIVVIMVGHSHLKENMEAIKDKIIFDTKNIIGLPGVYRL